MKKTKESRGNTAEIEGLGKKPLNNCVQKSNPLVQLCKNKDISLMAFKLLDIYLSRINSHEPDRRTVIIPRGELEQVMGVKRLERDDIAAALKSLSVGVDVAVGERNKVDVISLFQRMTATRFDDDDVWSVRLTCTEEAMQYVFNVDDLGYLRYRLGAVANLRGRMAYVMFMYLESNRFRGSWTVELHELKSLLGCDDNDYYNEFRRFDEKVLRRLQKELADKANCRFSYEKIKKGRKIVALMFTLESIAVYKSDEDTQLTLEDYEQSIDELRSRPLWYDFNLSIDGTCKIRFTQAELDMLAEVLYTCDTCRMPHAADGVEIARLHFMSLLYKKLLVYSSSHEVKHPAQYLASMIERARDENLGAV